MKKFSFKNVVVALLLLSTIVLAGCTNPETPGPGPDSEKPAFDATTLVGTFADKVDTTVKLTYVTNYQVDVISEKGGMDSFKRDVVATAVVEMDLGSDLYIKVSKTHHDRLNEANATTTEEILYKKDGKYYYQTSSVAAVEVADAAAKLAEIFETATYEQIGGLTLDALVYNALDKEYELKVFGLSETFYAEDLVDPVYAEANGGLKVTYKPEYVGYKTDGGWSDFSNNESGYAATIELVTNNKGFVTSMKETYNNASLNFNIMTPPPTVVVTGERNFTATYGEAITKVDSVTAAPSVAVLKDATNGTYVVKTCANGDFGNMSEVANGGALEMGKIICVKPAANEGYEVAKVIVNGNETPMVPAAQAGGFYCFPVAPGENTIEVVFKSTSAAPAATVAVLKPATGGTYVVKTCAMGDFGNMTEIANGGALEMGKIICVKPTANEGYEVEKVIVNGNENPMLPAAQAGGFYCFNVAEGENTIEVVFKSTGATPAPTGTVAVLKETTNGTYVVKTCAMGDFGNMSEVANGGALEMGKIICVKPAPAEGYEVDKVIVNGNENPMLPAAQAGGFYCFNVAEGENTIEVVFKAK